MIDENEIRRVNRAANRWLAAYLVLLTAALASIAGPGWLSAIAIVAVVIVGVVYSIRATQAWDLLLDAADDLGLSTWKHRHYRRKEKHG